MKKDERTEKEDTAITSSEEKNSPEGGGEENTEQPTSRPGNNTNNSESTPENPPKKNYNFVRVSGKKTLFFFFLVVVILAGSFGYVYRDQVKTVLPNALVEFFTGIPQFAKIETQESIQNQTGIEEIEKQDINSEISELSIEESNSDQIDFSASDHHETGSSLRSVDEAQPVSKLEKLEDEEILLSEKIINEGPHLDASEDQEKTLKVGNSDILAIVKELHKIIAEIETIDFTKNFQIKDNPALNADRTNNESFSEKLLDSLKGLITIRKIKDYEGLSLTREREKSLKNQFAINLISGKTMLITGFHAEALDDIRRARKILNLVHDVDEENVTMMIGRLDEIIYRVKEMD
tara:strand:- start:891 stop:1940 length:1050 start_codon:yes stop_codon:yes gene_type:complete